MSHVYQPVMLKRLLIGSGTAKVEEIALDLVQNDLSQIEYYTDRVHNRWVACLGRMDWWIATKAFICSRIFKR